MNKLILRVTIYTDAERTHVVTQEEGIGFNGVHQKLYAYHLEASDYYLLEVFQEKPATFAVLLFLPAQFAFSYRCTLNPCNRECTCFEHPQFQSFRDRARRGDRGTRAVVDKYMALSEVFVKRRMLQVVMSQMKPKGTVYKP